MTRLTKETALSSMFHKYIMPTMSIIIIAIKHVTIVDVKRSNDNNTNVQIKIAPSVSNN